MPPDWSKQKQRIIYLPPELDSAITDYLSHQLYTFTPWVRSLIVERLAQEGIVCATAAPTWTTPSVM